MVGNASRSSRRRMFGGCAAAGPRRKSPRLVLRARMPAAPAREPGAAHGGCRTPPSPPAHRHVATVDGVESPLRPTPTRQSASASRSTSARRPRFCRTTANCASAENGRLHPADGWFRRVSGAEALALSELAPESAGGATGGAPAGHSSSPPLTPGFRALKLTDFVLGASFERANLRDDLDCHFLGRLRASASTFPSRPEDRF